MITAHDIISEIKKVIIGKDEIIEKALITILAQGHILIEDIPGVGKTTLALAFSRVFQLDYKRIQFTPDTMPSDVIGFSMYDKETGGFVYKPGAIMSNLVLADEINRTSSKTQSALLEAMEEGNITVDGITYELPKPFIVISTQNPFGSAGTQMLPLSQLDRFLVRVSMGYPDKKSELSILKDRQMENPNRIINPIASKEDLIRLQSEVKQVYSSDAILEYITNLLSETRENPYIDLGVSPRGGIAINRVAKARAFLNHRDYVIPDDVINTFEDVCGHRIILNIRSRTEGKNVHSILQDIIMNIKIPQLQL